MNVRFEDAERVRRPLTAPPPTPEVQESSADRGGLASAISQVAASVLAGPSAQMRQASMALMQLVPPRACCWTEK
jgi:hypothetical protein